MIGIEDRRSEAELMNTCTIGTASNSAGAAAIIVEPEDLRAVPYSFVDILWKTKVKSETRIRIVPGR